MIQWLADNWAGKTLAELRAEAQAEPTGMVYEALRAGPGKGKRVVLVACATGPQWIAALTGIFDFADDGSPLEAWETLRVFDVALRTVRREALTFEACRVDGELSAVTLIAADPRSIAILEKVLGLS